MTLLLNSNIYEEVEKHIRGSIARVGGRVGQLINYKDLKVTDINLPDGGFGAIEEIRKVTSLKSTYKACKHLLRQEVAHLIRGKQVQLDRKTLLLDMHFAFLTSKLEHKFDASISSNMLEHSPNIFFLLLNFYFITKKGGYQLHAIPNYKYTFDLYRKPTSFEHILDDFVQMTWFDDTTHNDDYINSGITQTGYLTDFHKKYPVSYPCMHFHGFDEKNVRKIIEFMFEDVTVDIIRNKRFGDNLVIFKNKLNDTFVNKYQEKIDEYHQFINSITEFNDKDNF